MDDWVEIQRNEHHIARERAKAKALRQSAWWHNQCAPGICHYCKNNVGVEQLTMDHVVPVVRGGCSVKSNIVPACETCNRSKRAKTPAEQILAELEQQGQLPPPDDDFVQA